MTDRPHIIAELDRQLEWRGPGGRGQGHIVLERKMAEDLLALLLDPLRDGLPIPVRK